MHPALPSSKATMPSFVMLVAGTSGSSKSRLHSGMLRRRMVPWQTAHNSRHHHNLPRHSSRWLQQGRRQTAGLSLCLSFRWVKPSRVSAKQPATRPAAMSNRRKPQWRRRLLKRGAAPAAAVAAAAATTMVTMMLLEAAAHQTMMKRRLHLPVRLMRMMRLVRRA